MNVEVEVKQPHALLVVDASNDKKKFEYAMTDRAFADLQNRGVVLATKAPLKPKTLREFIDGINAHSGLSTLLIITHGTPWLGDDGGACIRICDQVYPWAFASVLGLPLQDKLISLAICHGLNASSGDSLIRSESQALMVVGPNAVLRRSEVEGFFPPFYGDLFAQGQCDWPKEFVQEKLDDHNSESGDKMGLRSFV